MTTVGQTHQGHGRDAHTPRLPVYEVRELQFSYERGAFASQSVIQNMSFSVESGEMLGIVGPNGSGKTSLLKLLANIASGQQGSIALFGRPLSEMQQETVAKSVAFVPQDTHQAFPFRACSVHRPAKLSNWSVRGQLADSA